MATGAAALTHCSSADLANLATRHVLDLYRDVSFTWITSNRASREQVRS